MKLNTKLYLAVAVLAALGIPILLCTRKRLFETEITNVVATLVVSIIWALFKIFTSRLHRFPSLDIVSTVYDITIITCLIVFATVVCCRLTDHWSWIACTGKECLANPTSRAAFAIIAGLICTYLVSLAHLVILAVRVVSFIKNMNSRGRFGPVGVWLYSRGYSTDITWYFVSGCLSIVVLSLFLASQDALSNYISQESMAKVSAGIWKDGYPLLMFLLFVPPFWSLTTISRGVVLHTATPSVRVANIYDSLLIFCLTCLSISSITGFQDLSRKCDGDDMCIYIWKRGLPWLIPSVAIVVIVDLIHIGILVRRFLVSHRPAYDKSRVEILLGDLSTSGHINLSDLHGRMWTNKQLVSIFGMKTIGTAGRHLITTTLGEIRADEIKRLESSPSKYQEATRWLYKTAQGLLDWSTWTEARLELLRQALESPEVSGEYLANEEEEYWFGQNRIIATPEVFDQFLLDVRDQQLSSIYSQQEDTEDFGELDELFVRLPRYKEHDENRGLEERLPAYQEAIAGNSGNNGTRVESSVSPPEHGMANVGFTGGGVITRAREVLERPLPPLPVILSGEDTETATLR